MSSSDLADFWVHTVSVQTYQGTNGAGVKTYATAQSVPCFLSRKLRFVRDANGNQITSSATVSADTVWAAMLTAQSKVTVDGRVTTVISVAESTGGALITGIDRVKVYLQ